MRENAADYMMLMGAIVVAVALGFLFGLWVGILFMGIMGMVAGWLMSRDEMYESASEGSEESPD